MATKGYSSIPIGFRRVDNQPLEANTRFESLENAINYVSNDPTAYPGQIITVISEGKAYAYLVETNKTLKPLSEAVDQVHMNFKNLESFQVEHALGRIPAVIMKLESGEKVTPKIDYVDERLIQLSWNGSLSGEIYLV